MGTVSAGDVVAEKYRVERLLGRGGMGYVVAARHLQLDQLVAIKFLRKTALSDEEALARFRREAKACVRLKSEHVAKVFDVGVHGEEPFIVMEHLEGSDLGAITKRPSSSASINGVAEPPPRANSNNSNDNKGRALPITEACDYVLQACQALAEAHALGIVHRDIKLPNLFLTRSASGHGLIKVLDFGVSKTVAEHDTLDVTQTAAVLGSPKYMSPEQMNDPRSVDGRTDIWSLGVCLYRLLTGFAPFDGDTIGRLCTMVLHEVPLPLSDRRPDVSPQLEAIVTCCLQKDRAFRFANMAELAASLAPFASEPEVGAEIAQNVASVLGLDPAPPFGYMPPPPPASANAGSPMFRTTGQSLEGAAAWAHTMVEQKREKKRSEMTLALVAAAFLIGLTIVGGVLVRREDSRPTTTSAAVASPPPREPTTTIVPVTPQPTTLVNTTTPTIIIAPSPPPPVVLPAPSVAPATVVTAKPKRSTSPATKTANPGELPVIPGDRK